MATLTPHFRFGNSHPAVQLGPIAVVNSDDTDASLLLSTSCALPPLDNVLAVMSVYRISAKIIRTSCAVYSIGLSIDTARIVCVAGSMKRPGACPSRLSVSSFGRRTPLQRVCCCGPGGQKILVDCCTAGAQEQMRSVSRCQLVADLLVVQYDMQTHMNSAYGYLTVLF